MPGVSLRVLGVLGVSAVNVRSSRLTAETQRTRRFRREIQFLSKMLSSAKDKIPSPFLPRKSDRLATGSFLRREFPWRPEHPCARRSKAATASGQVSWLLHRRFKRDDLHSGATARDSHPLPYSSRSTRDTQTHLKELYFDRSARYHACPMKSKMFKCLP
jgi:hypothetical protein